MGESSAVHGAVTSLDLCCELGLCSSLYSPACLASQRFFIIQEFLCPDFAFSASFSRGDVEM